MTNAFEKLGDTLNNRMCRVNRSNQALSPEIGTITGGLGLKVGSVSNTIPKGDYLVSRDLTMSNPMTTTSTVEDHAHNVTLPSKLGPLKSGDRVLVVWCGYEPVVVAVLENS